jgi:hypothetical protein
VEETGFPSENHQPVASHWQTLSHNGVKSGNLSFIFDHPIIARQLNYIGKSENSCLHVFSFNTSRFSRPITDWSVENINPDMTLSMMLDASISPEKK